MCRPGSREAQFVFTAWDIPHLLESACPRWHVLIHTFALFWFETWQTSLDHKIIRTFWYLFNHNDMDIMQIVCASFCKSQWSLAERLHVWQRTRFMTSAWAATSSLATLEEPQKKKKNCRIFGAASKCLWAFWNFTVLCIHPSHTGIWLPLR